MTPTTSGTCSNCGNITGDDVFCCNSCPSVRNTQILARLTPTPGAISWDDPRAMQWRDPKSGADYYAIDLDGDIIVAGGLTECTDRLIEVAGTPASGVAA